MSNIVANLKCEHCGREARAIFGCPKRRLGGCPFVEQWRRSKSAILGISAGFSGLLLMLAIMFRQWWVLPICLAIFGLSATYREVQLYNPQFGIRLKRTTFAGIELSCQWTPRDSLLPIRLEASQSLAYPLSITTRATMMSANLSAVDMSEAAAIFRGALIDLMLKKRVEVYGFQTYVCIKRQRSPSVVNDYFFVTAEHEDQSQSAGVLENGIIQAIEAWQSKLEWTNGPTITDLVLDVHKSNRSSFESWLVGGVADDATARGLGQLGAKRRWLVTKIAIEWDAAHAHRLEQEQRIAQSLSEQLARKYPEFSRALDEQILMGIKSREPYD